MRITPEDIDAILPQTQCGLCGYGGCMPYAEALIFENAAINLCPPGGVKTLKRLGTLLNQDANAFVAEMEQKTKLPMIAVVREAECIGCTKCIQACPVDAILGSAKQMHSIISSECTGCELCIAPCPVDCIDMISIPQLASDEEEKAKSALARSRFQAREKRKALEKKVAVNTVQSLTKKQDYIREALLRAKAKKG